MNIRDMFLLNIKKIQNGCWIWSGTLNSGYGQLRFNRRIYRAHRLSYLLHFGSFKKKLFVCHKCDNPKCVNPDHLFLGTQKDNMKDMYSKNRQNTCYGEKAGLCKLTKTKIIKILKMYSKGCFTQKELSKIFKVSLVEINRIVNRKRWTHLKIKINDAKLETIKRSHLKRKLTNDQVVKIRNLHEKGESNKKLAKKFNINSGTVSRIINRHIWKHI